VSKPTARAKHGTDYQYRNGCRCDVCKSAKNRRMREYNAKVKARSAVQYPDCMRCGQPLKSAPRGANPMHGECRRRASKWIRKGQISPRRAAFQDKIDKIAAGTSGGDRVWSSGPCEWCGKSFVGLGFTCSERCRVARKFAKASTVSFNISPRRRAAIYERDKHTCQICEKPVDGAASPFSDWYPSLDHIIPRSHMLIPDHSEANLRTVHRICNSLRSDLTHMDDAAVRVAAHVRLLAA